MSYLRLILLISIVFFLHSCGIVREGFTNPKKNNSDEFLVEKKSPLVMPPEFDNLPTPNNKNNSASKDNKIKELVLQKPIETKNLEEKKIKKDFEETILEKIKKN